MEHQSKNSDDGISFDALRKILKSQYHASFAMLRETIEQCPDEVWFSSEHINSFWGIAYHALYFTHLYLQPNESAFSPWEYHQGDPDSDLSLIPKPYTKEQVLAYCTVCDQMVDSAVDALDLSSQESGFSWYKVSKLEHQFINIRHIQHHMAQLADRLRSATGLGTKWVSAQLNR